MDFDDDLQRKDEPRARRPRSYLMLLVLALLTLTILWQARTVVGGSKTVDVSIEEYLDLKKNDLVAEVWVTGYELEARMKNGYQKNNRNYEKIHCKFPPVFVEGDQSYSKLSSGIKPELFHYDQTNNFMQQLLLNMLPWILLSVLIWYFFFRQIRATGGPGNILSFGKSRARFLTADKVKTTFADVAGIDEAKEEVGEIVEFLKNPQKFTKLGGRIPHGILLVGPPGT